MTIRHYKRQARLRASANGTSLQAELNAIARENGHVAWGEFQAALKKAIQPKADNVINMADFILPDDEAIEIEALVDAFEAARDKAGHLIVLRAERSLEIAAIALLKGPKGQAQANRLAGASFMEALTTDNMAAAQNAGLTLIAGSGDMPRDTTSGNFIVHDPEQPLRNGQGVYSKRDQQIIYATTAVKYILPQNDAETIKLIQRKVGATTIKRTTKMDANPAMPSTHFCSVDQNGMAIEIDWNTPMEQRKADCKQIPFMPAFNILGPKFLPQNELDRSEHIERVANIMVPALGGNGEYFTHKGRSALIGFLHVEIGRAEREGRTPSIPALIDWINGGLRAASEVNDRAKEDAYKNGRFHEGDALSDWLKDIVLESIEHEYASQTTYEIMPLVSMAPNERSGILGTMDKGFLWFKNQQVRARTS